MHTYTEMKKQIEKIEKEVKKLQEMGSNYEQWQSSGSFTTNTANFAKQKMEEIRTACQGLEMVLI